MMILIKKCCSNSTKMTLFLKPFSGRADYGSLRRPAEIKCGNGPL